MGLKKLRWILPIGFLLLSNSAFAGAGDTINDQVDPHVGVVMRTIGHRVLHMVGDSTSRVLPIQKAKNGYLISFETSFGFDPDLLFLTVKEVMDEAEISNHFIVEAQHCFSEQVVHSFRIKSGTDPNVAPCKGRALPSDCYNLLVTFLDHETAVNPGKTKEAANLLSWIWVGLLFVGAGAFIWITVNKQGDSPNPNLVSLGDSIFDKKNMVLKINDQKVVLSNKEAELLWLLYSHANTPIERDVLLQRIWGDEGDYVGRTLDVFISKLRKKLSGDLTVRIINIRGVGYKLVTDTVQ